MNWIKANVQNLILGNEFEFRVSAINEVGTGESAKTKDYAKIGKESITWTKPAYETTLINKETMVNSVKWF